MDISTSIRARWKALGLAYNRCEIWDKRLLSRDLDRSWYHSHISVKFFGLSPWFHGHQRQHIRAMTPAAGARGNWGGCGILQKNFAIFGRGSRFRGKSKTDGGTMFPQDLTMWLTSNYGQLSIKREVWKRLTNAVMAIIEGCNLFKMKLCKLKNKEINIKIYSWILSFKINYY